jgi:hypothetical protein
MQTKPVIPKKVRSGVLNWLHVNAERDKRSGYRHFGELYELAARSLEKGSVDGTLNYILIHVQDPSCRNSRTRERLVRWWMALQLFKIRSAIQSRYMVE